jgi:hypothetical protein
MATGDVLITVGTQIVFADHAGDFSPATNADLREGSPTTVQLALASVAAAAARQSAKVDLGASRAPDYSVMGVFEVASAAAVAGERIALWWGPSPDATAAVANPGGISGTDSAYTGTALSTMANSLFQLQFIGAHVATLDDTADGIPYQIGVISSSFVPAARYGSLVVVNNLTGAFHSDDVEMHVVFIPNIPQVQS